MKSPSEAYGVIQGFIVGLGAVFTTLVTKFNQFPVYLRAPRMVAIELSLFYFYHGHYSPTRYDREVADLSLSKSELTYGEASYGIIERAFSKIKLPKSKHVFVDLGSGHGKLVFYVNQRFGIRSAGVEIVPTFVKAATKLAKVKGIKDVRFIEKDFTHAKISSGTIIFVSLTCMGRSQMAKLRTNLMQLKKGAYVISLSQPLNHRHFKVVDEFDGRASWGKCRVYVQRKLTPPAKLIKAESTMFKILDPKEANVTTLIHS